jgi:hypothetical protein
LRAIRDHFVSVACQDSQNFGAIYRVKMRASGANGDFAFAGGAAVAQVFQNFRAERFHWMSASNPWD